ncbi:MAG: hypothetical protein CVT59_04115 [Actinobacteria bacterium HGW-Actinobacteria-1]|nr:MAG: hypothetical protein CVT59_04115 [Actinobacteria bacterium HGW-Actinobacteria-1]
MSADDRAARIDAIAVKALLLAPGDTFAVPVSGDDREAERALADIERAIERQYGAGRDMLSDLARPDELAMSIVRTRQASHIIIERAAAS